MTTTSNSTARVTVNIEDLLCPCCVEEMLAAARALDGVRAAELDYQTSRLLVELDATVREEAVRDVIREHGYRCDGDASGATTGELAHRAQLAPITCGTKQDRMQYELPHSRAAEEHRDPSHEGAGGMSDPTLAAAMERDLRDRFLLALVLTIPVVLLSPVAVNWFGLNLIESLDVRNWLMLALSTPVVWYAGWMFIGGAWTSLRSHALNMSVLIATGVLAAWLSSLFLTDRGRGDVLRGGGDARHVRALRPLDGDEEPQGHERSAARPVRSGAADRDRAPRRAGGRAADGRDRRRRLVVLQAGRQGAGRWQSCERAASIDESAGHRRVVPVEKGAGDARHRRHRSTVSGTLTFRADQGRRRHRAGADRRAGRAGAELQGARPAPRRPSRRSISSSWRVGRRARDLPGLVFLRRRGLRPLR